MIPETPQQLTQALAGGHWCGSYGMACCPAHEDSTPSLCIRSGDRQTIIVKCHAGCDNRDVIAALRDRGLWDNCAASCGEISGHPGRKPRQDVGVSRPRPAPQAVALWRQSQPIEEAGAFARYLRGRGLEGPIPPTLRALTTKHPPTGLLLPTLIAAITDNRRQTLAVHRTFIRVDGRGKANVTAARMLLGSPGNGAIRLAAAAETIGLAEGLETAWSAQQLFGLPVWSAISAGRLHKVELPPEVRRVVLFADHDEPGRAAAKAAADAYQSQGRETAIKMPDEPGTDWNDYLMQRRAAA